VGDDRHDRRGMIGLHQESEAVGEDFLADTRSPNG
jgi:hypothetical protein